MAKNVKTTTRNAQSGRITTVTTSRPSEKNTSKRADSETFGVVAYTKGSRFKDEDVLAVVKRVLSQS